MSDVALGMDVDAAEELVRVNDDRAALDQISKHELLSESQEKILIRRARSGDLEAKQRVVACNVRLVLREALRLRRDAGFPSGMGSRTAGGLELADMVQEGLFGVNRAVEKFNPDLGYRFSTFATPHIRNAMMRALDNQDRAIRRPIHINQLQRNLRKLERQREQDGITEPLTDEEAAIVLEVAESEVRYVREAANVTASLDQPIHADETSATLGDRIAEALSDFEEDEFDYDVGELEAAIRRLGDRDRGIIECLYVRQISQAETAEALGLSRETIRKQEPRALGKLGTQLRKGRKANLVRARETSSPREVTPQLAALIERLPETDARAITLRHVEGKSPEQAAKALGLSDSEFTVIHKTAVEKLRRLAEASAARKPQPAGAQLSRR